MTIPDLYQGAAANLGEEYAIAEHVSGQSESMDAPPLHPYDIFRNATGHAPTVEDFDTDLFDDVVAEWERGYHGRWSALNGPECCA